MSTMMAILIVTTVMFMLIAMILVSILKTNRHILKSERDKTEIIKKSEIKYRTLVNTIEETIIVVDEHGKFKFFHSILPALEHYNSSEYIGKSIYDMFPKKTADVSMKIIHDVIKTGHSRTDEVKIDIGKGNEIWINSRLTPQFDAEGKVVSVLGVVRDRTQRIAMEEKITHSEEKYRTLVESMEDTVYIVDKTGRIQFFHTALPTFKHLNHDHYIGKTVENMFQRSTDNDLMDRILDVFKSGSSRLDNRQVDDGNGKKQWFATRLIPQLNNAGEVISVLGITSDVTSMMETVSLLTESKNKYRSLVNSMEDTVFVIDKKGYFEFSKTNLPPLKHLNEGGNLGKTVYDLLPKKIC